MPNHVYSRVVIKGKKEDIAAFLNIAKKEDWDINALYPNPLSGFTSPVRIVSQEEYDTQEVHSFIGRAMTQEMHDKFVTKSGTASWYDWAKDNWGTKWGVYSLEEELLTVDEVALRFSTAWSPATKLWRKVSEMFLSSVCENVTITRQKKCHFVNLGSRPFK